MCPGCGSNHLDLFPDAFAKLANPSKGVIPTTWSYVDCPISSPIELHNKEGVSQWWFSMQVVNANKAVKSLEFSTDGGNSWHGTTRQSYNFFEYSSGSGTNVVDVKVTSVSGDIVIVKNVAIAGGSSTTASSNFGSSAPLPSSQSAAAGTSSAPVSTPAVALVIPPGSTDSTTTDISPVASNTDTASPIYSSSMPDMAPTDTPTSTQDAASVTTDIPASSDVSSYQSDSVTMTAASSTASISSAVAVSTVTVTNYNGCPTSASPTTVPASTSSQGPIGISSPVVSQNITTPTTPTPSQFTGSASTFSSSLAFAGFAAFAAFFL